MRSKGEPESQKSSNTFYKKKREMALYEKNDPQAYRYCDHPRPGSIYRLLDIPELVRGPTLVLLPSGKEIQVPRMERRDVVAPAEIHSQLQGNAKLQDLLKMLTAKQGPSAPAGFKMGRAPSFQLRRDHPRQNPQRAGLGNDQVTF